MIDELTLYLNSPISEEQWDAIEDVDFDHTDRIWFHTKHGKDVEFVKVVRCKDCRFWETITDRANAEYGICAVFKAFVTTHKEYFCACGERRKVTE